MTELITKLKAEIKRLINENIVDVVIAFKKEDSPLRPQPAFFRSNDSLEDLEYNSLCQNNLANYLTKYPHETRIGIVVRGCESRSVNALVVEKQHPRENLYLIGVPCQGIVDLRKLINQTGEDISGYSENQDKITVIFKGKEYKFDRQSVLHDSCVRCVHPNPVNADVLIAKPLPEGDPSIVRKSLHTLLCMQRSLPYVLLQRMLCRP